MNVGIESLNGYMGRACIDVRTLFEARKLDLNRFNNLMMNKKSVALPCEDPVSIAVNAAKPIIDKLSEQEKNSIEMVITASESGIDFGKSMSTYIHHYLGIKRECRLFEMKQACYAATAGLQLAASFVVSGSSPEAKVLIIATDCAKSHSKLTYAEPSQGIGAVAMLVSNTPDILKLDFGANGYYGYEVMDTCRPTPELETGDPDLSLLSYLDCLENSYQNYVKKMGSIDFVDSFDFLAFHTPYGGMVKSAHKNLIRILKKSNADQVEKDFLKRVKSSLSFCVEVGNVYSASLYLALLGLISEEDITETKRVGLFSYGSGCSSEFFSGIISPKSKSKIATLNNKTKLFSRSILTIDQYDEILDMNMKLSFGIQNAIINTSKFQDLYDTQFKNSRLLILKEINNYHRIYEWS